MSGFQPGTQWVPLADGSMTLQTAAGTRILTVSATGAVTLGAAATVPAFTLQSVTTTERNALANAAGVIVFNSTTSKINFNTGAGWEAVTSA